MGFNWNFNLKSIIFFLINFIFNRIKISTPAIFNNGEIIFQFYSINVRKTCTCSIKKNCMSNVQCGFRCVVKKKQAICRDRFRVFEKCKNLLGSNQYACKIIEKDKINRGKKKSCWQEIINFYAKLKMVIQTIIFYTYQKWHA